MMRNLSLCMNKTNASSSAFKVKPIAISCNNYEEFYDSFLKIKKKISMIKPQTIQIFLPKNSPTSIR